MKKLFTPKNAMDPVNEYYMKKKMGTLDANTSVVQSAEYNYENKNPSAIPKKEIFVKKELVLKKPVIQKQAAPIKKENKQKIEKVDLIDFNFDNEEAKATKTSNKLVTFYGEQKCPIVIKPAQKFECVSEFAGCLQPQKRNYQKKQEVKEEKKVITPEKTGFNSIPLQNQSPPLNYYYPYQQPVGPNYYYNMVACPYYPNPIAFSSTPSYTTNINKPQ